MTYVLKIKYEDTLRRLSYYGDRPQDENRGLLSFARLEAKIREIFKLPKNSQLRITYTDKDNDIVTMGDDQDLEDACVVQALNPLRLNVVLLTHKDEIRAEQRTSNVEPGASCDDLLREFSPDAVKPCVVALQPLLKGSASPRQLSDLLETIVKTVTSQIVSSVKSVDSGTGRVSAELFTSTSTREASTTTPSETAPIKTSADLVSENPEGPPSTDRERVDSDPLEAVNVTRVFHTGVKCDGCGVNPIIGPRFKSSKKHDYDLCLGCFKDIGNSSEYTRMDRSVYRPRHMHSPATGRVRCPALSGNNYPGKTCTTRGPYGARPDSRCTHTYHMNGGYGGKLDARFVQDVTILDGTELPPRTKFTKTWRLRNSGTLSWPAGTKIVQVSGDDLGCGVSAPLDLPQQGLSPEEEVEVSVEFVAPERPGRYVSHWRLASPLGPKFGHRVWVSIQVVEKVHETNVHNIENGLNQATLDVTVDESESTEESSGLNLVDSLSAIRYFISTSESVATPSAECSKDVAEEESVVENALPFDVQLANQENNGIKGETPMTIVTEEDGSREENPFSKISRVEKSIPACEVVAQVPVEESKYPSVLEPKIDVKAQDDVAAVESSELGGGFSMVEMPPTMNVSSAPIQAPVSESSISAEMAEVMSDKVAPAVCDKLEAMGFTNRKLILELLEKNKLDFQRTLDDLCVAAEWDPILEELEEMGFYDVEMNRRLMFKNNGSVKRVVKELVQMYKEPMGKGKQIMEE